MLVGWLGVRVRGFLIGSSGSRIGVQTVWSRFAMSTGLRVPESVRGMLQLDKQAFSVDVDFPILTVDAKDVTAIRNKVRLEKQLVKNMGHIKNLMNDPSDGSKKMLLFDPDAVNEQTTKDTISQQIEETTGKRVVWATHRLTVGFEHWDANKCIKAVLPDGLDFRSFTQTGHLIHCNFRDEILPYKNIIGQILLEKVRQCRTVVHKLDKINSEFRFFELELIAGEPDYVAELIEGGVRFKLDFSKVYWNSRLSHEHARVLKGIDSRALVYDACAGVGPFALPAAKRACARVVLANDLNPESVRWMRENADKNHISSSRISISNKDAVLFLRQEAAASIRKEVEACADPEWTPPSAAHILMNLPAFAVNFLPAFRGMMSSQYASASETPAQCPFPITAYCYLFAKAHSDVPDEWYEEEARRMVAEKIQCKEAEVVLAHHVRTVSSRKEMFCMQIRLPWSLLTERVEEKEEEESSQPPEKRQKIE